MDDLCGRFTNRVQLTTVGRTGFSKKVENYAFSVALFVSFCNFCCNNKTLRLTPATEPGISDRLWEVSDIVALVEAVEGGPGKPGSYKMSELRDATVA
jgi:hypothetical protein